MPYLVGWLSGPKRTIGDRMCESTRRFESCPHRLRIIFLNTWHAGIKTKLFDFISKEVEKTDIFCFQEFDKQYFDEMAGKLPNFNGIFWTKKYINDWDFYQSLYINRSLPFEEVSKNFQAVIIKGERDLLVCNIHGVSLPGDKKDSEERLKYSKTIIDFAKIKNISTIIGGDFNLNPDTKSVKMFEEAGYRNLVEQFGIKTTRNHFAWNQAMQQQKNEGLEFFGKQYFADYVFTSPDVKVKSFEVPNIEISDHLPLILGFEI